jgi:glycosyltransferase involved in cell wall biosynthesis
MASYNHAPFIRAAVESVLAQTFTDWELVITDDGSSDGTLAALDGFADERLSIEAFPENRSACVALNHCIRRARGRFIAVLNSDDVWMPGKLAKQLAIMEEQPRTAAVFTLVSLIDERGAPLPTEHAHAYAGIFDQPNRDRAEWLRRLLFEGNCLCHPSVLVRSEIYRDVGMYDERLAQLPDYDMWIRICLRHDLHVLQERLTLFRLLDHDRNASGNRPEPRVRCLTENMLIFLTMFREWPGEMAAMLTSATASPAACPNKSAAGPLAAMLAEPGESALPHGMRAAQILWMYEQLSASDDWRAFRQFISRTGARDPFGIGMQ